MEDAKATVVAAEMTLLSEVRSSRVSEEPPPTVPVDVAAKLEQLRSSVAELQREREELRSELSREVLPHHPKRVAHASQFGRLSTPASDLMVHTTNRRSAAGAVGTRQC